MYGKIVLAGGRGYLGNVLINFFKDKAKEIHVLSRTPGHGPSPVINHVWNGKTAGAWASCLVGADLVVNLAGRNVNCRYTESARREILESRVDATRVLGEVIAKLAAPPKVWINLASATIYRHAEDRPQDEESGEIGSGFSVDVCRAWERTFFQFSLPSTRRIAVRTGIVIGPSDGAFPRLRKLVKFGLGGHQGAGSQMMSWIHEEDFARIIEWCLENNNASGIYNLAAPEAVSNRDFMRFIREAEGAPFGLPASASMLRIGARLIGTETELILKSRWVYPKRLLDEGYVFRFPSPGPAIREICSRRV
jgi:uncharacterized protein (TIGR01777 family)